LTGHRAVRHLDDRHCRIILQAVGLAGILALALLECRFTLGPDASRAVPVLLYCGIGLFTTWAALRPAVNAWQAIVVLTLPYIIASAGYQYGWVMDRHDPRNQIAIPFLGMAYVVLALGLGLLRALLIDEEP
jgi:hypothetical protein